MHLYTFRTAAHMAQNVGNKKAKTVWQAQNLLKHFISTKKKFFLVWVLNLK